MAVGQPLATTRGAGSREKKANEGWREEREARKEGQEVGAGGSSGTWPEGGTMEVPSAPVSLCVIQRATEEPPEADFQELLRKENEVSAFLLSLCIYKYKQMHIYPRLLFLCLIMLSI